MSDGSDPVNPPANRPCDTCGEPAVFTEPGEWGGDIYLCRKHTSP